MVLFYFQLSAISLVFAIATTRGMPSGLGCGEEVFFKFWHSENETRALANWQSNLIGEQL
jgi:hypothetical protein